MAVSVVGLRLHPGEARAVVDEAPIPDDPEYGVCPFHHGREVGLAEVLGVQRGLVRHGKGEPREMGVEELAHGHGAQQFLEYVHPCPSASRHASRVTHHPERGRKRPMPMWSAHEWRHSSTSELMRLLTATAEAQPAWVRLGRHPHLAGPSKCPSSKISTLDHVYHKL